VGRVTVTSPGGLSPLSTGPPSNGLRVMEGVQGAAVDREAPVDARGLHLGGERVPLRGRHDRVFRPDPGPHRAADARRLARSAGGQCVDCPDRAQVDAVHRRPCGRMRSVPAVVSRYTSASEAPPRASSDHRPNERTVARSSGRGM
jgi:hypothetical protein